MSIGTESAGEEHKNKEPNWPSISSVCTMQCLDSRREELWCRGMLGNAGNASSESLHPRQAIRCNLFQRGVSAIECGNLETKMFSYLQDHCFLFKCIS
uniref:Uncharacterized protein n=1 Tax=Globodera rostochiensis TaxID=31243 RepID=A0A914HX07_GLORO